MHAATKTTLLVLLLHGLCTVETYVITVGGKQIPGNNTSLLQINKNLNAVRNKYKIVT